MTLTRATEILNQHQHRGVSWHVLPGAGTPPRWADVVGPNPHDHILEPFEAIAIAEKYASGANWDEVTSQAVHELPPETLTP